MNIDAKKKNSIFLTVLVVLTLLVAVVGGTFAYFTATIEGNDTASSIIVRTGSATTITYNNGQELKLENAVPGETSNTVTCTVSVDAQYRLNATYTLNWVDVVNTFAVPSELKYHITKSSSLDASGTVNPTITGSSPTVDGVITTETIAPGETHTYTMNMEFIETISNQNYNQNGSFTGKIQVVSADTAPASGE